MPANSDGAEAMAWDAAKQLVQDVEDAFGAADMARIEQGFTEDAVARFADFPQMHGRDAIMDFLHARFARTRNYKLKKTLHVLMGDMLANTWDASWDDARTGKPMLGRGTEIWRVRDGRIALWDATFNVWEKGGPPATPVV
jgi:nuclear transport factor 2 (NTF2) superfamily protein